MPYVPLFWRDPDVRAFCDARGIAPKTHLYVLDDGCNRVRSIAVTARNQRLADAFWKHRHRGLGTFAAIEAAQSELGLALSRRQLLRILGLRSTEGGNHVHALEG